jgi:hypothetical protein
MARPRVRPSKLPPAAASRKLVGNPKEGNQFGTDAQLDALRESLKVQMQSRRVPKAKVNSILNQIKQRYGDKELEQALREFNAAFRAPRDANIPKNPKHG